MIRPTKFILDAIGRAPLRVLTATEPGVCAMCGFPHQPGDPVMPFEPDNSFTDYTNLLAPSSPLICGWCAACWSRDFTQTYLRSLVSEEGIFRCASNDHIAYWLLNPPQGPFMIFMGDQKQQHVAWRTPVNSAAGVIVFRLGEMLMVVRPVHLRAATKAAQALAAGITEHLQAAKGKGRVAACKTPFVRLSRSLDDQRHGQLSKEAFAAAATRPELAAHIHTLQAATPGEIWALNATVYAKNPARPDPVLAAH